MGGSRKRLPHRAARQKNRGSVPELACKTAAWKENRRKPTRLTTNMQPNGNRMKCGMLKILLFLAIAVSAQATTYYVSTTGTDANPGSVSKPWRTIQKAANTLAPGDTVLVRSGTYNERVTVGVSGTTNQYITFAAYPGEYPVVDGTGLTPPNYESALFWLTGNFYIVIQGFDLRNYITSNQNATPAGIYVEGPSHDIQILNNTVRAIENTYNGVAANAFGIAFYGTGSTAAAAISNVLVSGNNIYQLETGSSETMTFNGNVTGIQVLNNTVHDTDNIGIDFIGFEGTSPTESLDQARNATCRGNVLYNIDTNGNPAYKTASGYDPSADGINVDGGANITIDRNIVSTCDLGIEVASEHATHYASNCIVRDNFIHHCYTTGISTGGYDSSVGYSQNCTFTNNTLYQDDSLQQGNGEIELQYNVTNCTFKNNILYANSQDLLMSNAYKQNSGNVVDYNAYYCDDGNSSAQWQWKNVTSTGFSAYKTASGNDSHSEFANPLLILGGTAPNLHIIPTSPAVDTGDPAFVSGTDELDIDGGPRIVNARVDIGAEEICGLERWRYANFTTAQLSNSAVSGDLAAPAGDEVENLAKYALGLNPWKPAAAPVSAVRSGGYLGLAFPRLQVASDITYHVQSAPDLINWSDTWTSGSNAYTGGTNASALLTVPDTVLETSTNERFMRLVISKP